MPQIKVNGTTLRIPDGLSREQMDEVVDDFMARQAPAPAANATPAPDAPASRQSIGSLLPDVRLDASPNYGAQVAVMSPDQRDTAMRQNDDMGAYLRNQARVPRPGETQEQYDERLYGKLSSDGELWARTHPIAAGAAKLLQGVPFLGENFDEAAGSLSPNPNATQIVRESNDYVDSAYPKTATALKVAGGLTGAATAAAALPAALTSAGPASLAGRVALGAGGGAGLGAAEGYVSGYGAGTDDASRAEQANQRALLGGLLGGALGGAAPAVSDLVRAGGRRVLDAWNVAKDAKRAGLSRPAYEALTDIMSADGSLAAPGARRLSRAGPDAMIADTGPNSAAMVDMVIQRGGPGSVIARQNIEQRVIRANQNVSRALDSTLGRPQGVTATETAIRQGSAPARHAAYETAYSSPIDYATPQAQGLEMALGRVPASVINRANRLMQIEGVESRQILARVSPGGRVSYERLPDVRQLDYITRALNDVAKTADGAGALGGQTAVGRAYQNLATDIRSTLRQLVPAYGKALDTAAEPIAARNALRLGQGLLQPSMARDEVASTLKGMSRAELAQVKQGIRSSLDDLLANVQRAMSDDSTSAREVVKAVKLLSSRANREKVALVTGQQEAARLFTALDRAAAALDLKARVADNSKTFVRTNLNDKFNAMTDSGVLNAVKSGEGVNAAKRLWQYAFGATPQNRALMKDKVAEEIARFLTVPRGPDAQGMIGHLARIAERAPVNARQAAAIGQASGFGFAVPLYTLGSQLFGRPVGPEPISPGRRH